MTELILEFRKIKILALTCICVRQWAEKKHIPSSFLQAENSSFWANHHCCHLLPSPVLLITQSQMKVFHTFFFAEIDEIEKLKMNNE